MKLAVPRQLTVGESRVALTPQVVKKLAGAGLEVLIESGAGVGAHHDDASYTEAGGVIVASSEAASLWQQADLVVTIDPPDAEQIGQLRRGAVLIGMLAPLSNTDTVTALTASGITSFSMEFIPRISRAQPMDVLSSQANIAGYKAVLMAANAGSKIYPMMITAAGTMAPSRVLVIGAGVAGLQAIATAKRLGAIVEAYDVRPVVKEQVQSLGARFVELPIETGDAQTEGGYAKEQSDEQRRKQAELMAKHVIGADAVITTAAVFGKAPPLLITRDVVERMRSGAVIVDMAADADAGRGNCELTEPGKDITTTGGVLIIGRTNLPALVPVHASQAYAHNMHALLKELIVDGQIKLDFEDEIQKGAAITHDGQIVNEMVKSKQ
jgi:NAD(P) transhydrogenase subunit alpha